MHSYTFRDHEQMVSSIAKVLAYSHEYPANLVIVFAQKLGFGHISLSSSVLPMVKIVSRGFTSCADAYLTPKILELVRLAIRSVQVHSDLGSCRYTSRFCAGFDSDLLDRVDLAFMQSDGGLSKVSDFSGSRAILSGPAGGVVGYSVTAFHDRQQDGHCPEPVIGFGVYLYSCVPTFGAVRLMPWADMGGTSTDVSRYDGRLGMSILGRQCFVLTFA